MAASLSLLAENYESSSDEETEQETQITTTKRKANEDNYTGEKRFKGNNVKGNENLNLKPTNSEQSISLPRVPASICSMFSSQIDSHEDDSSSHQGRIRTFQHEAGNWATHVYVPFEAEHVFNRLVKCMLTLCTSHSISLESVESFHLSISKTVVIRHHWINPLVAQLHKKFSQFPKFVIALKFLDVYTNEKKTRTFIALKPDIGFAQLKSATEVVDQCFAEFKLPQFYKPPSFHVSIAWCLGDQRETFANLMPQLQECCEDFIQKSGHCRNLIIRQVELKTGSKLFPIMLK